MGSTLWMGDIHRQMEENFIAGAFSVMGHKVTSVKVIRDKSTGFPAGYCFVDFSDPGSAQNALMQLNGKSIPGSQPSQQFRLNFAGQGRNSNSQPQEFSMYVGDLSSDVTDILLFETFSQKYPSVHAAKVVIDDTGASKGFGFVRFTSQTEHQAALVEMQRYWGLGRRHIRVSPAIPKSNGRTQSSGQQGGAYPYGQFYTGQFGFQGYPGNYYYNNQQQQQRGGNQQQWWTQYQDYNSRGSTDGASTSTGQETKVTSSVSATSDDHKLEDPGLKLDVDKFNKEFMEQNEELFISLEASRWHPLNSVYSTIESSSAVSMIVTE